MGGSMCLCVRAYAYVRMQMRVCESGGECACERGGVCITQISLDF